MYSRLKSSLIVVFLLAFHLASGNKTSVLRGNIQMDSSWSKHIYLSQIPSMDKLYTMSNEMIITKAKIDSLGDFQFDISFLPKASSLYRLHLTKVGDSPNTLIIGGSDENFMFIILKRDTTVNLKISESSPPFKMLQFENSQLNTSLYKVAQRIYKADSTASESDFLMSQFLDQKLNDELIQIADTSSNLLIALYALYHSDFEATNLQNQEVIHSFFEKWENRNSSYLSNFQTKAYPYSDKNSLWSLILTALLCLALGFFIGRLKIRSKKGIQKLSVQERKVYELLKTGASNQDIAEHFSIGLSTVKTHVSKIFNKLNVKSRKDLMD